MQRGPSKVRQMQLLRYIRGYQVAKGYSPSFSEMALGIGLSPRSKGMVSALLDALEARGLVRRLYMRARAIDVLVRPSLPMAPDGAPLFAVPGFGEAD